MVSFSDHTSYRKETLPFMTNRITQDMQYRQSFMNYAEKYGVSRKYNKTTPASASGKPAGTEKPLACRPDPSAYSSADFLDKLVKRYARRGIEAEYVQTNTTGFPMQSGMSLRSLKPLPKSPAYVISASGLTHQAQR